MSVANFKDIFKGLDRARGVTYVDKKGEDGQKIKQIHHINRILGSGRLSESGNAHF